MPRYPHTKLFSDHHRIVVLSGPHIQVLDTHGRLLLSTVNFAREDKEQVIKSGPIRCSGISKDGRYLATSGDDKQLKIWDLESLTLLSGRELPKKPTSIEFSRSTDILISDKFGDVFRYALHPNKPAEAKSTCGALASHETPLTGKLVLGHASLLTDCLLSQDEKFIITADRDEHIRVSWYPEGYVIENYCFGHKKYVSAIHIPTASPTSLISGGGDPELKVWDWVTGHLRRNITVFPAVEPFIVVSAQNRRHEMPSEICDDEDEGGIQSRSGRDGARKGKQQDLGGSEPEDPDGQKPKEDLNKTFKPAIFLVRKIGSFLSGGETHIVFSAVGATAIFEFTLTEVDDQPNIRHHDFRKPVIDFTVGEGGTIWVLLDADFAEDPDCEHPHSLVQTIQWSVNQLTDAGNSELLDSLNTICSLPAMAGDLKYLDLYADLSSLPKSIEGEQTGQVFARQKPIHRPPEDERSGGDPFVVAGPTKRALGRLKHKRALDQLHHKEVDGCDITGPDTKKMRAQESDNVDSSST